jgi:hypothetical protein
MSKVELAIENIAATGSAYDAACAVLLAALMEEFGDDVTDRDIQICIDRLHKLKADLKET